MGGVRGLLSGRRSPPPTDALLAIGIPAYAVVVGFSVWDVLHSHSPLVATAGLAAIAVFSVAFLWLGVAPRRIRSARTDGAALLVMAVLAVALAFLGSTTELYLITVAAMAGDTLGPRLAIPAIIAASTGVALYSLADDPRVENVLTRTMVPIVIGLFAYGGARLMTANDELTAAREELADLAVAHERLRFARDMHDLLGHSLTVIRAKSELASRLARDDPAKAAAEMEGVEHLARQALVDVREAVTGYRHVTLAAEVANGRAVLRAAGITPEVAVNGVALASEVDETLGWVVREAITNVVRHSRASRCRVATVVTDGEVQLEVTDDGCGGASPAGSGLTGVRERLAAVGGTLDVRTSPDTGFRVVARVPVSG